MIKSDMQGILLTEHKVIAGFLYTKMKIAEIKKQHLNITRRGNLMHLPIEDYEVIEILGILIDNAIEASSSGDEIFISIAQEDSGLEIQVSNPFSYLSNQQFLQFFEKEYTTKSEQLRKRGYGLANVKELVEKYNGKLITGNKKIAERNYVMFGVKF